MRHTDASPTTPPQSDFALIRIDAVRRLLGGPSRATIWRHVAAGKLPRPIKLGAHALWSVAEIRQCIAAELASR